MSSPTLKRAAAPGGAEGSGEVTVNDNPPTTAGLVTFSTVMLGCGRTVVEAMYRLAAVSGTKRELVA